MAYPTYFPQYYPNPFIPLQPVYQNQMSGATQPVPKNEPIQPQTQMQVQSGGFIPVPSEDVARNYPVGNGLSITFKDENAPYVYTKTMGFNQLDAPVFTKYRLVKEDDSPVSAPESKSELLEDKAGKSMLESINAKIEQIESDIDEIRKDVDLLKEQPKRPVTRKKDEE